MRKKQREEREKAQRAAIMEENKQKKAKAEKLQKIASKKREADRKAKIEEDARKAAEKRGETYTPPVVEENKEEEKDVEEEEPVEEEVDLDKMEATDYVMMVQRETYADNIERALRLNEYEWDIQDFVYHEKHVDGNYSYLDKFDDDDYTNLERYYEACLLFMKMGHMPKEIAEKTMAYFYAFGPKEIYENDIDKLYAWASSIQILDFKLKRLPQFIEDHVTLTMNDVVRDEEIERD